MTKTLKELFMDGVLLAHRWEAEARMSGNEHAALGFWLMRLKQYQKLYGRK